MSDWRDPALSLSQKFQRAKEHAFAKATESQMSNMGHPGGFTAEGVAQLMRQHIDKAGGGMNAWARLHGLDNSEVSRVLNGHRRPSSTILRVLGLEKRYVYVREPKP